MNKIKTFFAKYRQFISLPDINLIAAGMMLGVASTRSMDQPYWGFWISLDLLMAALNFSCFIKLNQESKNGS